MKTLTVVILMALSAPVFADDTTVVPTGSTPGSVWDSLGTTPVERDNWVNLFHLDQGVVVGHVGKGWEVTPYAALNLTTDSNGYSWDNTSKLEGGVKLVKHYNSGEISLGAAYGLEHRDLNTEATKSGLMVFADGWFGYKAFNTTHTPGSGWFSIGNTSPFEQDNVIGLARIEQGYNFSQTEARSLGVVAWGQAGFDTRGDDWNNRHKAGGGLRASTSGTHGSAAITVGYECFGGQAINTGCGPAISVDLWDGWNKIGGK